MPAPTRRRPALALAAAGLVALAATACGPAVSQPGPAAPSQGALVAPDLADVTPMTDPGAHDGVMDVDLPDAGDRPGRPPTRARRCPPRSPTPRAREVTVTDTSRILALDIYGTLAHTVFELGLGDRVVGRDVSLGVRRDRRPAARHPERPRAQRRGDPRARPDRGPHRHLARPVRRASCSCGRRHPGRRHRLAPRPRQPRLADPAGRRRARRARRGRASSAQRLEGERRRDAAAQIARGRARRRHRASCARSSSTCAARPASTTCSARARAPTPSSTRSAATTSPSEIGWQGMKPINDEGLIDAAARRRSLMMTRRPGVRRRRRRAARAVPGAGQTPAGEHQRIVAMDDDQVLSFGPRTADVLNALAVALYAPDALVTATDLAPPAAVDRAGPLRAPRPPAATHGPHARPRARRRPRRRPRRRRPGRGRLRPAADPARPGARLVLAPPRARPRADADPPARRRHAVERALPAGRDGDARRRRARRGRRAACRASSATRSPSPAWSASPSGAAVAAAAAIVFGLGFAGTWTDRGLRLRRRPGHHARRLRAVPRRRPHRGRHPRAHRHRGQRGRRRARSRC